MSQLSVRMKYICRLGYGDALPKEDETAGNIPVFGSNGQYATIAFPNTQAPAIVIGRKGSYGKVNWVPVACFASDTTFFVDHSLTNADLRWLYWALQTLKLDEGSQEAAVPGLNRESVYEARVWLPEQHVQRQIALFLDRETSRIDALIAEKERMLALLEEKRAALISRVVTRGLDPDVPMKPSGQAWLGEIPAHWEIQPIKYLAVVGNGSTPSVENTNYWDDEGYPWLNSSVVNESPVRKASRFVTETALSECHLPKIQPPAVLVGITGQGKTRGMASLLGIEATINQHLAFIKPHTQNLHTDYLCHLLEHGYAFLRSESDGAGSTKGAITCEQLANMKISVPPSREQLEICTRMETSLSISKPLQSEIMNSINLLMERRAALITAAVTGQIHPKDMAA